MTAFLVAVGGPSSGKRYPLEDECVLGRSFNSDVYIGDLNVSRRHARIIFENEQYFVEDLESGNGTFVGDEQIQRQKLSSDDIIRIGGSSFRFELQRKARWGQDVMTMIADAVNRDELISESKKTLIEPVLSAELEGLNEGRALKMLKAMYAITDVIASELDLDKLLQKILDHLFVVFPQAERGFVLLVDPATGQLVPEAVKQRNVRRESERKRGFGEGLVYSRTIVDQVLLKGTGVIHGAKAKPAKPRPESSNSHIHGEQASSRNVPRIGSPLMCGNEKLGTMHIEAEVNASEFSQDDLDLLSGIARQAALAISNAKAGQQLIQHERLNADLEMARKIQESFMPHRFPTFSGIAFETHYAAASHVGGDFYDVIELSDKRLGILIGDVSGHGVAAALIMARLTTAIRLYMQSETQEPGLVLTHANKTLLETEQDAIFATVLFILLDLERNTFTIANAGHQPPMVCSNRFEGISELDDATAVALGVVPDIEYPQAIYQLIPGDVVLLYTDGINEAMNKRQEEYGMARLKQIVIRGQATPRAVVKRVISDVRRFVGSAKQNDDQTLVAFGIGKDSANHTLI